MAVVKILLLDPRQYIFCGFRNDQMGGIRAEVGARYECKIGKVEIGPKKDVRKAVFTVIKVSRVIVQEEGDDPVSVHAWRVVLQVEVTPSVSDRSIEIDVSVSVK